MILDRDHDSSSTNCDGKGQDQDLGSGRLVFLDLISKIKWLSHLLMYGNRRDPQACSEMEIDRSARRGIILFFLVFEIEHLGFEFNKETLIKINL